MGVVRIGEVVIGRGRPLFSTDSVKPTRVETFATGGKIIYDLATIGAAAGVTVSRMTAAWYVPIDNLSNLPFFGFIQFKLNATGDEAELEWRIDQSIGLLRIEEFVYLNVGLENPRSGGDLTQPGVL